MFLSEVETGCSKMIRYTSCMLSNYSYLYRFARSFVNPDLAEDLVQETFFNRTKTAGPGNKQRKPNRMAD